MTKIKLSLTCTLVITITLMSTSAWASPDKDHDDYPSTFDYKLGENNVTHPYIMGKKFFTQPELVKPEKGGFYFDPIFGLKITRISDRKADDLKSWINASNGSLAHPSYPRHNYDNSDGSYLLFDGSRESGKLLYDAQTLKLLKSLNASAVNWNQPIEPRWDAHDPNLVYYHFRPATALSIYNVKTDDYKILHDFSKEFPGSTCITMQEEGDCSNDSRYFGFLIKAPRGGDKWAHAAVVCYDRIEDRVVGTLNLPIPGFENQGAGNWVGMSPSGKYVVLGTAPVLVFDREFKKPPTQLTHGGGWHCDLGLNDEGKEVIFYPGGSSFSPGGQSNGCYAMCDIETGVETVLTEKIGGPEGVHFDCSCILTPGWGLVSTYHPPPAQQNHWAEYSIHLVELTERKDPPPRIWRICHTHVNRDSYTDDPFATFNRFGTKIFFGSNWGIPIKEGGDIDAFQVDLPPTWYEDLMGREKATRLREIAHKMVQKNW